ncbi:MAG: tetratricopeptide repeat protein [Pirellulaceae bacterium]
MFPIQGSSGTGRQFGGCLSWPIACGRVVVYVGLLLAPLAAQSQTIKPKGPRSLRETATAARESSSKPTGASAVAPRKLTLATPAPMSQGSEASPRGRGVSPAQTEGRDQAMDNVRPVQHTEESSRPANPNLDQYINSLEKEPASTNPISGAFQRAGDSISGMFKRSTPNVAEDDPVSLANMPSEVGVEVYLTSARVLENKGNAEGAERQYRSALEKYPTNRRALLSFARLLHREGRLSESRAIYLRAAEAHANDPVVHNDLGLCQAKMGQVDEALASVFKAITLAPSEGRYRNNIATILANNERLEEAYSQLEHAHGPVAANYNLGYLLYRNGDRDGAIHYWQAALKADPSFQPARQMLDTVGKDAPEEILEEESGPSLTFRGPGQPTQAEPGTVYVSDGRNNQPAMQPSVGRRLPPVPEDSPRALPQVR